MQKVVVTGGSGSTGSVVVKDLVEHGYDVLNIDITAPKEFRSHFLKVDLMDLGQVFEALAQADMVVHLGAIPAPGIVTEEQTFRNNMLSTYNVFHAATSLGIKRIVWASTARVIGVPYEQGAPQYVPIDENHPHVVDSSYSLSKILAEDMARYFHRLSGIPFIGFRFSYILQSSHYEYFRQNVHRGVRLRQELWGYVDVRDAAQCCRLGLEADITGTEVFMITAADLGTDRSARELLAEYYPSVEIREPLDAGASLFSIKKAQAMLGYRPQHSWRDQD